MNEPKPTSRNPWAWIPSLYFAEGLPNVLVATVSVVFYKNLGLTNAAAAFYTSWLYLPWVLKPLWSRWWMLGAPDANGFAGCS